MSSKPDLEKSDLARIHRELEIIDSRWLIAQFEAFRLLSSISELRFVRMSSEIQALTRERLLSVVSSSIERGKPAIGEALISTILEREAEGTLSMPFPKSDIELLKRMAVEVSRTPRVKDH